MSDHTAPGHQEGGSYGPPVMSVSALAARIRLSNVLSDRFIPRPTTPLFGASRNSAVQSPHEDSQLAAIEAINRAHRFRNFYHHPTHARSSHTTPLSLYGPRFRLTTETIYTVYVSVSINANDDKDGYASDEDGDLDRCIEDHPANEYTLTYFKSLEKANAYLRRIVTKREFDIEGDKVTEDVDGFASFDAHLDFNDDSGEYTKVIELSIGFDDIWVLERDEVFYEMRHAHDGYSDGRRRSRQTTLDEWRTVENPDAKGTRLTVWRKLILEDDNLGTE